MERESEYSNVFALIAAAAWLIVPVTWSIGAGMDESGGGGEVANMIGWAALVVAGVFMLVAILRVPPTEGRSRTFQVAIAFQALGLIATVVVFWAIPLWAVLYAVAMVLYALGLPQVRTATGIIAGAMAVSVAAFFILTSLKVGSPDSYGDYPVAWATSVFIATIGGALGTFLLSRQEVHSNSEVSAAV